MSNNDIILVSETHLSRDIDNEDIQLRGFQNPIRVDRNRHGGGVAIFAKPNIYICEKPEFHTSEIEILWLEVIINNLKAMVGVIYRPPHSDVSYWRKFENNIQPILDLNIPVDSFIFKENTPILAFHFMDYGIIISLIIFSNCAFITLLFTRFDINVYTDWAVVTAKVRGNFNIKNKNWSVCNK
jgi:hypothetical protein